MTEEKAKFSEVSNFFPKQFEALEATKKFKYVLYGGSVGAGKSRWLRWALIYWVIKLYKQTKVKGIRVGLFCEDYPSLNDRHLSKIKQEFPEWLGTYNQALHEFQLKNDDEFGGGVIAFRNLDDPSKYLSVEFAVIAVDEINRNKKPTFDLLRSRLRWPNIPQVKFIAACNPIGEAWVKNFWVKRLYPPEEKETQEFYYVKALSTDNPHLPKEYYASLESQPENVRKAYLEGDWDSFGDTVDPEGYLRLLTDTEISNAIIDSSPITEGVRVFGVDPAAGGDNSSIVLKTPLFQYILFNQKLMDTMDLVEVVVDLHKKYSPDVIVVDKTGVGQGVLDRLRALGYNVRGVAFGEKSKEPERFQNLKAELYWKEREWIVHGGKIKRNDGLREFEIIKYKTNDKKIVIQSKDELRSQGLSSPNVFDACVLTLYPNEQGLKNDKLQRGQFYDRMSDIWHGEVRHKSFGVEGGGIIQSGDKGHWEHPAKIGGLQGG